MYSIAFCHAQEPEFRSGSLVNVDKAKQDKYSLDPAVKAEFRCMWRLTHLPYFLKFSNETDGKNFDFFILTWFFISPSRKYDTDSHRNAAIRSLPNGNLCDFTSYALYTSQLPPRNRNLSLVLLPRSATQKKEKKRSSSPADCRLKKGFHNLSSWFYSSEQSTDGLHACTSDFSLLQSFSIRDKFKT